MSRVTNDRVVAEQFSRDIRRKVILTEMHAGCAERQCDIDPIVDDQSNTFFSGDLEGDLRFVIKIERGQVLSHATARTSRRHRRVVQPAPRVKDR